MVSSKAMTTKGGMETTGLPPVIRPHFIADQMVRRKPEAVPVHEIETVIERDRHVSPVRLFTLIGGLTGTASGFLLTIWSAMKWGLITGGKPIASIPPFVIIAFELTILFGGLASALGAIVLGRLPRLRFTGAYDPRFTNDRFGVAVHCAPDRGPSVREILTRTGAEEVKAR